jgi:hypothetical protein
LGELLTVLQYACISNKMQRYIVYLYLETALHVSGSTSTHHQESIQLYLKHLVFVTPLLLSDAIVEELEPVWVCCAWRTLLMMGMRMPETCWAVSKWQVINLRICCIWLVDSVLKKLWSVYDEIINMAERMCMLRTH